MCLRVALRLGEYSDLGASVDPVVLAKPGWRIPGSGCSLAAEMKDQHMGDWT